MEEVNRLFSFDALLFIPIIVIIFHIFLVKNKEWKTIAVFHIAGILNFTLELIMINSGTRIVESQNLFLVFMVLFCLSYVDMGLFCSLAYLNINRIFKNSMINFRDLIVLNIIFFIGMPLASINWGIFNNTILTRRIVQNPAVQSVLQLSAVILAGGILSIFGYKKLALFLLGQGIIFGISFQTRLYIAGIRQASIASPLTMVIDTLTLASMPILAGALLFSLFGRADFYKFGDAPPLPRNVMNLRIYLTALKVIVGEIGLISTFALIGSLISQKKDKEPWKNLEAPKDWHDKDSRELIGDAILFYHALLEKYEKEKALAVIKKVIMESAIAQLYSLIPKISADEINKRDQKENEEFMTEVIDKFPNADWEIIETSETRLFYKITKCRLVELVNQVGHPELQDAFCPGDKVYFEKYQSDIKFIRPKTIGYGQDCCDFIFEIKSEED